MNITPLRILLIALICSSCLNHTSDGDNKKVPDVVDYNFHVRPILSDKCFACHGPDANKREADLRLDTQEGAYAALKDYNDKFAIVSGNPEQSEAYLRITSQDSTVMMPPPESNLKLSAYNIDLIKKWIEQGAAYKPHWAFVAPERPNLPKVSDDEWPTNEIDHFILAKLDEKRLKPNETAAKSHLLKRVSFDLTGLPPTLAMQEAFEQDTSPNAYEKMVDQLLDNKHYGEKMAIHWLDIARYADSHGYQDDGPRTMWPWRDWVIHAFNENYPFDQFLTWQLAGDLLAEKNVEALLATGFNRNHKITQEGGVIDEEYRIEYVTDRTNTFGKAFLGLTYECAKCHDHKYDPISQNDYYSTFAFFDKVPEKGLVGTIDGNYADPPRMEITDEMVEEVLTFVNKKDSYPVAVMVMEDSVGIRDTHILDRGNYDAKTEVVTFNTPKAIMAFDTLNFRPNRLGLSKWLLSEKHPLTSRVFVNRIWQEIFGRGIVKTAGDFGMQGELPTHPELLDWLAVDFRENGWDIKRLVKQIVMSSTYTQSARNTKRKQEKDPENSLLSRMHRTRLGAEMIRDHVLASSGLLNDEIGGPSVKPYQPDGIWLAATSGRGVLKAYVQDHGENLYRRGIYTFIKRTVPPPSMLTFDASNRDQCEVRRLNTGTPLQALVMLNDPTVLEASRVLAENLGSSELEDQERIKNAFKRIVCREAKPEELDVLLGYYNDQVAYFKSNLDDAGAFLNVGEYKSLENRDDITIAALMQVIHTMYNLEEATTRS
ncbi:PSD1 and planctomycete cytochrome C domain-containing protein [Flagellimonas myxillae]|uniref:PSD1 and planctomycete cytochrome C domain-containing protein n=1 Tax=Flagellimonas myxillae TaxID=2942214 RepID=UPI00201F3732|nr:PSD1 and planctomycete cytochrome C domain-containing protein [Muricauda myxillae]MCL6266195.1 PSD1 and planctomycete cytochrome C domain-containing protein [Muricauda myxillae]